MIKNTLCLVPLGRSWNVIVASRKLRTAIISNRPKHDNSQQICAAKYFSSLDDSNQNSKEILAKVELPINLCCMESCVNCVWLQYADELVKEYKKKGLKLDTQEIFNEIDKDVEDVNVKAYIKLEIKSKLR